MKTQFSLFIVSLFLIHQSIGQTSPKEIIIEGKKSFIKKNEQLRSDCEFYIVADNKSLTLNLQNYINNNKDEFIKTHLELSDLKSVINSGTINNLNGLQYYQVDKKHKFPFVERTGNLIFFIGYSKDLSIIEFEQPGNNESGPKSNNLSKKKAFGPNNKACRQDCHNAFQVCSENCDKIFIEGGSLESYTDCYNGCGISLLGCSNICDNYVQTKTIIELKGVLTKPATTISSK